MPLFQAMDRKPVLVRVRRDRKSVLSSYARRGSPGDVELRIEQLLGLCSKQYERWPWQRLTIEYELLAAAVSQFDMGRYHAGMQRPGGDLPLVQAGLGARPQSATADEETLAKAGLASDSAFAAAADGSLEIREGGALRMQEDGSPSMAEEEAASSDLKGVRKQEGSGQDWLSGEE
jgi:hypothetical protein